jgi:hypothetical protein
VPKTSTVRNRDTWKLGSNGRDAGKRVYGTEREKENIAIDRLKQTRFLQQTTAGMRELQKYKYRVNACHSEE